MTTLTKEQPPKAKTIDPTRKELGSNSLWRMAMRRLVRQRSAIVGMVMLGLLVFLAIFAGILAPFDPEKQLTGPKPICFQNAAQSCGQEHIPSYAENEAAFASCLPTVESTDTASSCASTTFSDYTEVERRYEGCVIGEANRCEDEYTEEKRTAPCIHALGCPEEEPQHLMGTDGNTRDMLSRIIYGSRVSLFIGFFTIGIAIVTGTTLGAIAGYYGGWFDLVIMRIMDVLLAFPSLLLAIAIVAVLGPGLFNALLAISIVSIPHYARLMRASVLSIRENEYVEASEALGAEPFHILFRRILPNALTPLIVQGTLGIATAIVDAAALSFLGFGAQPPTPEWGAMLGQERSNMFSAPHLVVFPGIMITLTVLAFNLIGDGLRDALDPRLAQGEGGAVEEAVVS